MPQRARTAEPTRATTGSTVPFALSRAAQCTPAALSAEALTATARSRMRPPMRPATSAMRRPAKVTSRGRGPLALMPHQLTAALQARPRQLTGAQRHPEVGGCDRHRTIAARPTGERRTSRASTIPGGDHAPCVRSSVADRLVHRLLRVPPLFARAERGESGALADQCAGASVGGSVAVDAQLVVFGAGRVQGQLGWSRLVTMVDQDLVRGLT